jgi:hypothetical protein
VTNRKKKLKKGIDSIEKQIALHEEKLKKAEEKNKFELVGYYTKEILAKRHDVEEKKRLLKKD